MNNPSPAVVGSRVSNLRRVLAGGGDSGLGTLGFFAAGAGARDWSRPVLVSNRHVLLAHGAAAGDVVYQPGFEASGDGVCFLEERLNPVATLDDEGLEGHHRYAYPGEPAADYFVDAASARLLPTGGEEAAPSTSAPGSSPLLFRSVARTHPFDALPGRGLRVRKAGIDRQATGRLVDVAATVADADGELRHNCLVVRALPPRGGGRPRPFAGVGDSGALVVDEHERAVGLVWGFSLADPTIAYACHLAPLLDRLGLVPWQRERPPRAYRVV